MNNKNPFQAIAENAANRERLVSEYAAFLQERAQNMRLDATTPNTFASEDNRNWLLDQVDILQEKDEWDVSDISRFSSLFFFLLTSGD